MPGFDAWVPYLGLTYCWGTRSRDPMSQDCRLDSSLSVPFSFPPSQSSQLVQYKVLLFIFKASSPRKMHDAPSNIKSF